MLVSFPICKKEFIHFTVTPIHLFSLKMLTFVGSTCHNESCNSFIPILSKNKAAQEKVSTSLSQLLKTETNLSSKDKLELEKRNLCVTRWARNLFGCRGHGGGMTDNKRTLTEKSLTHSILGRFMLRIIRMRKKYMYVSSK